MGEGFMLRQRKLLVLSCLILFSASATDAPAQTWKKHRYAADGFEMEFSGNVITSPVDISAESKKIIERSTSYIQGDASTAYILTATLYKVAPDLDAVAKRGYGALKCKTTVGDSPLTIAGGRGRELRGSDCDKGVNAENRYYLKGKWLYHAIALYKKDGGDEKAARYFIQSFKPIVASAAATAAPTPTPATANSNAPIVRTLLGLRYEIPAGWEWTEFTGHTTTIQHIATRSGEMGK
jgi:hypothetical protein